jgi:VirE N-terminal domain
MQLFHASNLTDVNTALQPLDLGEVVLRIRTDVHLRDEIARLRKVKSLDVDAFRRLKTRLPIVCCGEFRDGLRRTANFERIGAFVLDVDHYSSDVAALSDLRARLTQADDRIAMAFVSPGGDGLKLLFVMDAVCTDTKRFSDFYKAFAYEFGDRHGLTAYIDFRTADATRVCFLSYDADCYHDPLSSLVCWSAYLPEATQSLFVGAVGSVASGGQLHGRVGEGQQAAAALGVAMPSAFGVVLSLPVATALPLGEQPNRSHAIRPDVYKELLVKLETKARPNPLVQAVFVPEVLEHVMSPIATGLAVEQIAVTFVRSIQFGKQLDLRCGADTAALNVYYGKRGFSVVVVPRQQSNGSFGDLCQFLVEQVIYSRHDWYDMPAMAATDMAQTPAVR